jgi:hypothetical protein
MVGVSSQPIVPALPSRGGRMLAPAARPVLLACVVAALLLSPSCTVSVSGAGPDRPHEAVNSSGGPSRHVVSFDFGWKHRTGLKSWASPDDVPPNFTDPGKDPPEAQVGYDDSDWEPVQLPHDGLIVTPPSKTACPDGCSGRSYIPRHVLWYRKQFRLPLDWTDTGDGDGVDRGLAWLTFEGSFRNTSVWLDGKLVVNGHACGYTPFTVDLSPLLLLSSSGARNHDTGPADDVDDDDDVHTIAVFVDPDNGDGGGTGRGSGWWYEGGGLYRHVSLTRTASRRVHVQPRNGLFVKSTVVVPVVPSVPQQPDDSRPVMGHTPDLASDDGNDRNSNLRGVALSASSSSQSHFAAPAAAGAAGAILEMEATFRILHDDRRDDVDGSFYCHGFEVKAPSGHVLGSTPTERLDVSQQLERQRRPGTSTPHTISNNSNKIDDDSHYYYNGPDSSDGDHYTTNVVRALWEVDRAELWSTLTPNLYQVDFVIYKGCTATGSNGTKNNRSNDDGDDADSNHLRHHQGMREVDRVSVHHGIRTIRFDPNDGFFLNGEPYKIRGFCDHDTFAVVGMAVPDRINLFRVSCSTANSECRLFGLENGSISAFTLATF